MNYKNIYIAMRELTRTLVEINENSLKDLDEYPLTKNYIEGKYEAYKGLLKSFNSMEDLVKQQSCDASTKLEEEK